MVPGARELSLRNLDLGLPTTETISVKLELHYFLELSQTHPKGGFDLPPATERPRELKIGDRRGSPGCSVAASSEWPP